MSIESKRAWREANPERYAEYERKRAKARRDGSWDRFEAYEAGREPRVCHSSDSYYRHEWGVRRTLQKMHYGRFGPDWRSALSLPLEERVDRLAVHVNPSTHWRLS
jgi:hypothetical protein